MSFKGAIFDLDGVIVDTVPLHYAAWRYLFTDTFGVPFTKEDYEHKVDGKPRLDGVLAILPDLTPEKAIEAGEIKQKRYLELLHDGEIVIFPGSLSLIEDLISHGVVIAAASSSKNARYILEKIGLAPKMRAIISGYDFTHGKPHPEIFLNAAKAINLDVKECVVFEDAKAGVESAKAGGFYCVGIDRHGQTQSYILADTVVSDLKELNYERLAELLLSK